MEKKKKKIILCLSWDFADSALSRTENYLNNDNGGERALRGYYLYKAFKGKYEVKVLCYKNHSSIKEDIKEVPFSEFVFEALGFIKKNIWRGLPTPAILHMHYCDLMLKKHIKKAGNFIFFPRNRFCVSKAHEKDMKIFYNPIYPPYEKLQKIINRNKTKNISTYKKRKKRKITKRYFAIKFREWVAKSFNRYYTNSEEKCHVILTEGTYNEHLFSKALPDKKVTPVFSCHHHKTEVNWYLSEKKDDISRLLFVGHNFNQKNVAQLIAIFLKMKLPNTKLIICGDYTMWGNEKIYIPYRHYENIAFEGSVDPTGYYKSCDIFVFPTIFEGAARVCFEAMSYGMPIVTTQESGAPINKKNFVSLKNLEQELTEKLNFLIGNKKALQKLSEENFQLSKQFYVEEYVKNYVNYVEPFLK